MRERGVGRYSRSVGSISLVKISWFLAIHLPGRCTKSSDDKVDSDQQVVKEQLSLSLAIHLCRVSAFGFQVGRFLFRAGGSGVGFWASGFRFEGLVRAHW